MSPNHNMLRNLIIGSSLVLLSGCAGTAAAPPYFKDAYQETRNRPAAEPPRPDGASDKATQPPAKGSVKIIAIPNPLQKETVTAAAVNGKKGMKQGMKQGRGESRPQPQAEAGPRVEEAKPLELSVQAAAGDVQVVVENMSLYEFVNLAFGELLKLNYTVSPEVQSAPEKVTLNMNRKMPAKEFFPFVVDLLRKNNLEINDDRGVLFVRRKIQGQELQLPAAEVYVGNEVPHLSPQKRITVILSPSYVPGGSILQVVRQLQMLGDVKAETLLGTQTVALTGSVAALEKVVTLFNQLDRPSYAKRDFNLLYLDYINVVDFDKKMKEVLPTLGIPVARTPADTGLLTMPFEKINALLVVTSQKEWLDAMLSWKDKLDAPESMGDEIQLFIFQPKNRPAEELVEVLKNVAAGGSSASPAAAQPAVVGQHKGAAPAAPASPGNFVSALPGKGFTATLDRGRNAVIISASPANYKLIRNVLTQLDTPPRQVLIEATIMEVTLTDNLQYGVEWFIKHHTGNFEGTISTLGNLALGGSGLTYAVTQLSGDFQAKLNAFASKNLINIVSTPHIATLDGKEATITVGTEVPIVTAETSAADISNSTSGTPSILRNVQYRNTGTILRVKPVINSEGALTIDLGQELSEAQTNSVSNIDSPLILNRSIKTTLSCKSGETVLIGGLISTNKSKGESKIPILGDIPLIGNLFKTSSKGSTKTELLVQITPYILSDMDQLDEMTKKISEKGFARIEE